MKVKLPAPFYSISQFSQTIKGKVVFNNYAIPKVEVNSSTKNTCSFDANGEFSPCKKRMTY
jgi:hypothetical protein